ncbi:FadR/GntR family transcriptional regulator [Kribbella sp. CA-253562]|uniref:FadR/GntR family transcriptional regulator n=1 Tax=Kribbella sp. CA-253562 TaxID=3239942 RepID=UPI003D8E3A1D
MTEVSAGRRPLSLEPLAVPAAYEHVLARLRRAIQLSEILPGERLPSERDLAESLAVSRITVREALRVLQAEGVIATRRGKGGGTVVLPGAAAILQRPGGHDQRASRAREVREMRLALEPMAASLAASRANQQDLQRLRDFQADLKASTDIETFRRADSGFHLTIAAASGNNMLRVAIEDVRSAMFVMLDAHDFTIVHATSGEAHESILDAIAAGDAELAARRMEAHVAAASVEIAAALEEQERSG